MRSTAPRWQITLAFALVYLVWGSTYLAIRYAIATLPPFLMAGLRFLIAGGILYLWALLRGAPRPTRAEWRSAAIIGALMLLCGNGAVVWSEQRVASGLTALIVALVPAWTVAIEWALPGGKAPGPLTITGLFAGMAGMALLVEPGSPPGGADLGAMGVLALGSLGWVIGSIYLHRGAPRPVSAPMATGIQMLCGGAALVLLFAVAPGQGSVVPAAITGRSLLALGYLIVFGSLITYSAYVWLLQVSTPARVATYAYVNPVVALGLGWAVAGERLSLRSAGASALIVAAVAIITWSQSRRPTH
ncbi:MAG: EamA family transporter [Gemmatimonadales bacterium]